MCSTRVLVSTVESLLHPKALQELCSEAGVLEYMLCDDDTNTQKFEFDMSRNDDDGTQLPGRDVEEFTVYTNAGNRPPAPEGTVEEKATLTLSRIDERLLDPRPPYVLDGLLRRSCLAVVTGLGRNSQPDVVEWLVKEGYIELVMMNGEQWLRRTEPDSSKSAKPVGKMNCSESDKPIGEEDG